MSRKWDYDEDSHYLPKGMIRVGYDADTQVYTFKDKDGNFYHEDPGNRYGRLRPQTFRDDYAAPLQTSAVVVPSSTTIPSPVAVPSPSIISAPTDIVTPPMIKFPDHLTLTNHEVESANSTCLVDLVVAPMQALRRNLSEMMSSGASQSASDFRENLQSFRWPQTTYKESQRQCTEFGDRDHAQHVRETINGCRVVEGKRGPRRRGTEPVYYLTSWYGRTPG